jgi:hypothetical protein
MWVSLALGAGLQQMVTLALIILIWDEWPWPKFMLFAVAIGACGTFTTGLYVALVLLATKFPENYPRLADARIQSSSQAKCNRTISLEHTVLLLNGGMQNLKRR